MPPTAKILIVEPIGSHLNFNIEFCKIFFEWGHTTYVAPEHFCQKCIANDYQIIPSRFYKSLSRRDIYFSYMDILKSIRDKLRDSHFDLIFFLSYETISFSLMWPKDRSVVLFEHNNLSGIQNSILKHFFYKLIPQRAVHITFMETAQKYIGSVFNKRAYYLPHPVRNTSTLGSKTPGKKTPSNGIAIFSPSASTSQNTLDALFQFVSNSKVPIFLRCKGNEYSKTANILVSKQFDDYDDLMCESDFTFVDGTNFDLRVSGVVFDSLSFGTPVLLTPCNFAFELQALYPALIFIIRDFNEILNIRLDHEAIQAQTSIFLSKHSSASISRLLEKIVKKTGNPTITAHADFPES